MPFALRLGNVVKTDPGYAPNSAIVKFNTLLEQEFDSRNSYQVALTARADASTSAEELNAIFQDVTASVQALKEVSNVADFSNQPLLPAFETESPISLALIELNPSDLEAELKVVQEIKALLPDEGPISYSLTGGPAIELELRKIGEEDASRAEVLGLSISLLVLVLVFGAVIAASLPLMVAVMSISISLAVLYVLAHFIAITSFGQIFVSLLGLATGIDYALLIVNRFREELKHHDKREAVINTTQNAGKAVLVSGLTVLIALAALIIPPLNFIRTMGMASIIAMFFSMAIAITALPAVLFLLGERVNLIKLGKQEPGTRTRHYWSAQANRIMKRPVLWTVFGVLFLIILSVPALQMQVDFSGARGLTGQTDINKANKILEALGIASLQRSVDVLVELDANGFYHPSNIRAISSLTRDLKQLAPTDYLLSPLNAPGVANLLLFQYYATPESAAASPLATLVETTVSASNRYVWIRAFPTINLGPSAIGQYIDNIKLSLAELGLTATISGPYVSDQEWTSALYNSFPKAIIFVYLATFILLGLAFRSLLIPLKSIILNTLTLTAAYGVITAVFQMGWFASLMGLEAGLGFVETSVPVFIFAIVFGLSMDYEVFLVSRIYEAHKQGKSDNEAVRYALAHTGNVISSAALIMVIVFFAFIFSRVVMIKTLSLGLTVAIILDATLVRSTLVPAVMSLAGKWNWWLPKRVASIAERINFGHD
ncbi:MAG: MMPL family transporter [Trueperaceae bacterium]|nr:MMPL family transporter [Trueperaceae bacterium]